MSHSAPHAHPLQFTSDQSIDSKIKSDESLAREVQRTISLTSENPSETFFSADEDMHSSSLRTSINDRVNQKKRFASDLRWIFKFLFLNWKDFLTFLVFPTHSIGVTKELDGRLLSHRSDFEIHAPDNKDYRVNTKRPQSTAELVSRNIRYLLLLQKCCLSIHLCCFSSIYNTFYFLALFFNIKCMPNAIFSFHNFILLNMICQWHPLTHRYHSNYSTRTKTHYTHTHYALHITHNTYTHNSFNSKKNSKIHPHIYP